MENVEDDSKSAVFEAGRWNEQQQEKFIFGIMKYGKEWKKIEDLVETRTGAQVRSHAQKFFIKIIKINKQRRKQKKKQKPYVFTEFERDFLKYFKKQYVTEQTPPEIIQLLSLEELNPRALNSVDFVNTKNGNDNKICNNFPEQQIQQNETSQLPRRSAFWPVIQQQFFEGNMIPQGNFDIESLNCLINQQPKIVEQQKAQDESYLVSILRQNVDFLQSTHDFAGFIEFFNGNKKEKHEEKVDYQRNRKKSFQIPDEEENDEKLKITLQSIRKQMNKNQNQK